MASGKGSSRASGTLLRVATFVIVGGFLWWLTGRSEEYVTSISVEEVGEATGEDLSSATTIPVDVFGVDPMGQADNLIQINGLNIQSLLDSEAFFVEVAGQPYLVKMSESLVADSVSVAMGENVSVIGRVQQMTDSIADSWVAVGSLSEANKIVATFSETFIEALDVTSYSAPGGSN